MTDLRLPNGGPEFHVVVRHQDRRGPLGPYRLSLAVGFAMLIAGNDLLAAASSGTDIDTALINAGVAAGFIWILSGIVSRILASGGRPSPQQIPLPKTDADTVA